MYKKNINRIIWMILIVIIINLTITSKEVIGETIYVDDNGSADYSNIQNAIDNASEEDTVFVKNGKYYENIIIDKSITMLGESKENTIIISGIFKTAVEITADNVAISEFTIQNGSPGIKVYNSSYVFITKNNVFSVNGDGISLLISDCNEVSDNEVKQCHGNNGGIDVRGSSHNKIMNNKVTLTIYGDGIHLHMADDNLISNNIVNNNKDNGFEIHNSNNNILKNNEIFGNGKNGIELWSSDKNNLEMNLIDSNFRNGLHLNEFNDYNTIVCNSITSGNSSYPPCGGIYIRKYCNNNTIIENNVIYNYFSICVTDSYDNKIYHNNFFHNNESRPYNDVSFGSNIWDNGPSSGGNYWSDFDESSEGAYDENNDGIVDDSYTYLAYCKDEFPLLNPWQDCSIGETPDVDENDGINNDGNEGKENVNESDNTSEHHSSENNDNNNNKQNDTPGFEFVLTICVLFFILLLKRKRN